MNGVFNRAMRAFESVRRGDYVDKSELIIQMNRLLLTENRFVCVSRGRRFGKSVAAQMLSAYYDKDCDSKDLFEGLEAVKNESFATYLNHFPVIYLDITDYTTKYVDDTCLVKKMQSELMQEISSRYPQTQFKDTDDLMDMLVQVVKNTNEQFVFIIDEWDAICRELGNLHGLMDEYVTWLRRMFKGSYSKQVFAGVYMTGILPIKRYNTQSALNNFDEYTMLSPAQMAPYFGFTDEEVQQRCELYNMEMEEMKRWYDGYQMGHKAAIYNPYSVMKALQRRSFESYWTNTNVNEGLRQYITMDFDGLKDAVIQLIADESVPVNTLRFSNDLQKISSKDDVLTILCHLGYLTYDAGSRSVRIPNYEVRQEFENSLQDTGWTSIANAVKESEQLLMAVLRGEPKPVEEALDAIHADNTSILQYNDENSLSCVLSLAFYAARGWYTMIRELPTGSGFADVVLLPKRGIDKPAILLELKWNQSADTAIRQIHEKRYAGVLKDIEGEVILVGVNYDKKTKRHKCRIEKLQGVTSRSSSQNLKEYSRSSKRQKIVDFCHEPRSLEEIAKYMKVRDKYYMKRTHINPMLGVDIFMTEPDSPNSPNQKYYSK